MVNAAAAIDTGSSGFALFARAATAGAVLSSEGAKAVAGVQAAVQSAVQNVVEAAAPANLLQAFRYNSFEFSYRQDFGKIVLLRQEPDTGEVVQQFPTDYYLERYAESERTTRQAQTVATETGEGEGTPAPAAAGGGEPAPPVFGSAPAVAQSAPALPSGAPGGSGRVDITI